MISITLTSPEGVQRTFTGQPGQISAAARTANIRTAEHFRGDTATALAAAYAMKRSVFLRANRGRAMAFPSRTDPGGALMWLGYRPVKAAYAGPLHEENGGASAGQYYWAGSFIATMKSGHESIFKRQGAKRIMSSGNFIGQMRQPIVEQSVMLMQAPNIAAQLAVKQEEYWIKRFGEQLNYRINVRG